MSMRNAGLTALLCLHAIAAGAAEPADEVQPAPSESLPTIPVQPPALEAANTDSAPARESQGIQRIEEVIVTATKRAKSVRDIPESITAIDGDKLEDEGHLNLTDYIRDTPGVTVTQAQPGLTRFSMRGISTDTSPSSIIPSAVGFFIGDTAFSDPYIASVIPDLSAFDLAGVQVLKGPQGTLFGGAALSGAVRYELQDPVQGQWQFRAFEQAIRPQGGSLAFTEGAAVNVPILSDDNLALRADYLRREYPGTIDDTFNGQKNVDHGGGNQIRAILLWEPESWKFKLTHLTQDFSAPNALYSTDAISTSRTNGLNILQSPASNRFGLDSLELGYSFDSMRLVSLSSLLSKHVVLNGDDTAALAGKPPAGYPADLAIASVASEDSHAFSQEVRLQSTGSGPLDWLVGAYYYTYKMNFHLGAENSNLQELIGSNSALGQLLGSAGTTVSGSTDVLEAFTNSDSKEKALFFDITWKPWQPLELEAGARFYETDVAGTLNANGVLVRAEDQGNDVVNQDADLVDRGINPRLAATWHFSDNQSVYAQAAKGFRFGGIQIAPSTASNGIPSTFKSDSLWNFELGLRTSWLDHTLNADLTTFYILYKNPIIQQNSSGEPPEGYLNNVASSTSKGLEANLLWYTPLQGLSLSLSAALTDAHTTAPFTAPNNVVIQAGTEMPGVAPEQFNAGIQYLHPIGPFMLGLSSGYNYVSQGYSNLEHDVEINGYGTIKAGAILSTDAWSGHPKLALNVDNILNTVAATGGALNAPVAPGTSYYTYLLNPPRTYTLRLSVDF